jgi:hypothetical protein
LLPLLLTLAIVAPDVSEPLHERPDDGTPLPLPKDGAVPLDAPAPDHELQRDLPAVSRPYGAGAPPPPPPDIRKQSIVRIDFMAGPLFRKPAVDTFVTYGVEYGRNHGFSGVFHTGVILALPRPFEIFFATESTVRAHDFPIGLGAIARARHKRLPLFASIGLTAGMLVHRAKTERGVIHRVDPDLRVPIRFAWTIAALGISLALEQGYSVRSRSYSRRGAEVYARPAYRVGFLLGLHWDVRARTAQLGTGSRRKR